jgi:hypothetical protein
MNRQAQTTTPTTIHFFIKAAVEFVAGGDSICGLDAGDRGRKWVMKGGGVVSDACFESGRLKGVQYPVSPIGETGFC